MMDWVQCLDTFIKVVEVNSFAQAARNMYATPSAISKRIAWLEEELGVQLLHRTTRRLSLTEPGEALYKRSKPLLTEWDELKTEIATMTQEPCGTLHLGMSILFGNYYIVSILPEFLQRYPKITLDLHLTNRETDILQEHIDIFISHQAYLRNYSSLQSQLITTSYRQVYAAPNYLQQFGEPKTVAALKNHNCLIYSMLEPPKIWELNDVAMEVSGNYYADNGEALISAAVAGVGLVYASQLLIKRHIQNKKLQLILPEYRSPDVNMYAYYPQSRYLPRKCEVFLKFLREKLTFEV